MLGLVLFDVVLVALLKVLGQHHIPILSHSMHASLQKHNMKMARLQGTENILKREIQ